MDDRWCSAAAAAAALILAGSLTACSSEDDAQEAPRKRFYLSLGDSLAVGVQPDEDGTLEQTRQGYTDALHTILYDRDSTLAHERLGCGGEDTTSFVDGGLERCADRYEEGSQLAQAERFLKENGDRTELVTVGIGANNFTGCVLEAVESGDGSSTGSAEGADGPALSRLTDIDRECVDEGLERLTEEMPVIATRLRDAAGDDVQIVGMTYYNPFLAALLLEDGAAGGDGAAASETVDYATGVFEEMNSVITESYSDAGIDVADVAEAFESSDFEVPEDSDTDMPANVQNICDYTWMCDTARGPDIHTNQAGAAEIAETFAANVE
ncbi:lipase [Streptomonospora alba]|uniref:Lipase n=1 Tax=Streptomonospora alba TaxID=183763 RepID=A0A0C2JH07_9ACTN|nr:GDSL-type esterase/lipase family protein [Streptomonospora alba]KII00567.1 lipase [Streptomonospora alba]